MEEDSNYCLNFPQNVFFVNMMEKFSCPRTTTKVFQSTHKHCLTDNQILIHTMYATVKKTEISINKNQNVLSCLTRYSLSCDQRASFYRKWISPESDNEIKQITNVNEITTKTYIRNKKDEH